MKDQIITHLRQRSTATHAGLIYVKAWFDREYQSCDDRDKVLEMIEKATEMHAQLELISELIDEIEKMQP